ncbi:protein DEHYDRATION-INDUCED 19 isoform X1 [Daucus carota subsp. sativus]|uniref:protein DEHYDRATION-INDUCED 19 isoform X1 n=1 Tax=Daucus carota subsp. sativus TaxID=79200 RepID=UPI0007EF3501|nr:PREDICTED: protein DEHYDRATION-INDUCED 19-like [Daucus carota subsp. sativus]
MDSEYWTSRLAAAKRHFIHHHHQNNTSRLSSHMDRLNMDDFVDVEEDGRPDFPCPYCYEEYDLATLCLHLKDEHPSESRVTVCPVCSVKVARDMLTHIRMQHGHLLKLHRRRRLRRVAVPDSQTLSLLGRDLREAHLQVLLGGGAYRSSTATPSPAATDPLLSSLIMNYPTSEAEEITKVVTSCAEDSSTNTASQHLWKSSFDPSLSIEERQKRITQDARKAMFMQDLVVSTLLVE